MPSNTNIMAVTATANKKTRIAVITSLEMQVATLSPGTPTEAI